MNNKQQLSQLEYIESIQQINGLSVIDVFHTQDSMIRLLLSNPKNENDKFTLIMDGDWQIFNGNKLWGDSNLKEKEIDHEYYERLRLAARKLKENISKIINVDFSENLNRATIFFDNSCKIEIRLSKFGLLSLKNENNGEYVIVTNIDKLSFFKDS